MKSGTDRLRAAEKQAKEARKRQWKNYVPSTPKVTGKEREFTATVLEVNNGDALVVRILHSIYIKLYNS